MAVDNAEGGDVQVTLCLHRMHETCLSNWFEHDASCPICLTALPPGDALRESLCGEETESVRGNGGPHTIHYTAACTRVRTA